MTVETPAAETRDHETRDLEAISVARADGIVTITLRRPERKNAINGQMWNEFLAELRTIAATPEIASS